MVSFFLHRLVKLLQDSHTTIEWAEGAIYIYNTKKLETDILPNYYGHSKFTSFLRQLTSYGFHRMPADNGRPELDCVYKNESTTEDLDSILKLKRKASNTANKKNSFKKVKNPKKCSVPRVEDANSAVSDEKETNALSNEQEIIPTSRLSLSNDNQCINLDSDMEIYLKTELPILTVPMLNCKKIQNAPNVIYRSPSTVEPMTCYSNSILTLSSTTQINNALICDSHVIGNNVISSNRQCFLTAANEDLQFDNDFNNVLSSLMVADFSEQMTFCSEYKDVLKMIAND